MSKNLRVAFDVDGTLITKSANGLDVPRYEVINLLKSLESFGATIYVWSGGGYSYAQRWAEKLGIDHLVTILNKGDNERVWIDFVVDDEEWGMGEPQLKV
jgi:phosphoserine phosphatase